MQAPDARDAHDLERHHEQAVGSHRGPATEKRLQAEEQDSAGRVLRLRVTALQQLAAVDPECLRILIPDDPTRNCAVTTAR